MEGYRPQYIHIQLTDFLCEMIEDVLPIIVGSLLPAGEGEVRRRGIKLDEKKDERKYKEKRKEIMRLTGWKNNLEADMEDGRVMSYE